MNKIEILCETCDEHFIIITKDNEPEYCPFCQTQLSSVDDDDIEED